MKRIVAAAAAAPSVTVLAGCGQEASRLTAPASTSPVVATADDFSAERARIEAGRPGGGRPSGPIPGGAVPGVTRILFVHASPDAPAVDINLGSQPMARGLRFPNNTPYRYTWSGSRDVRVNVAGTSTTVIRAGVTLQRNTFYSVFATGTVSDLQPLVLVDDLSPPARGQAHVRFVHLSPNAPAVDVAVANGGPIVFGNQAFRQATAFTPLPSGTYDLEVRVAGTSTVALMLPGVTLQPGKIYTVFAKGLLGGTGAQSLGAGVIVNSALRGGWLPFRAERAPIDAAAL